MPNGTYSITTYKVRYPRIPVECEETKCEEDGTHELPPLPQPIQTPGDVRHARQSRRAVERLAAREHPREVAFPDCRPPLRFLVRVCVRLFVFLSLFVFA